jgi:hypothetical protein
LSQQSHKKDIKYQGTIERCDKIAGVEEIYKKEEIVDREDEKTGESGNERARNWESEKILLG